MQPKLVTSALRGWRAYTLEIHRGTIRLRGGYGRSWNSRQMEADELPATDNSAGIYLSDSPLIALEHGSILAHCIGWGRTVRHTVGFRAQHSRIEELHVPCQIADILVSGQSIAESLAETYQVPIVTVWAPSCPVCIYIEHSDVELDLSPAVNADRCIMYMYEAQVRATDWPPRVRANIVRSTISTINDRVVELSQSYVKRSTISAPTTLIDSVVEKSHVCVSYANRTNISSSTVTASRYDATMRDTLVTDSTLVGFSESLLQDVELHYSVIKSTE